MEMTFIWEANPQADLKLGDAIREVAEAPDRRKGRGLPGEGAEGWPQRR